MGHYCLFSTNLQQYNTNGKYIYTGLHTGFGARGGGGGGGGQIGLPKILGGTMQYGRYNIGLQRLGGTIIGGKN